MLKKFARVIKEIYAADMEYAEKIGRHNWIEL